MSDPKLTGAEAPPETSENAAPAVKPEPYVCPEGLGALGCLLESQRRPEKTRLWRNFMFALMALLVVLNIFTPNHHPHFVVDRAPGFWPAFGFFAGVVMVFLVKKIVQPLIRRPEDYYGDL